MKYNLLDEKRERKKIFLLYRVKNHQWDWKNLRRL